MDERIHRHSWENGRCTLCGTHQPDSPMTSCEHRGRLQDMHLRLERIEAQSRSGSNFIMILLLIVIGMLLRGC